MKKKLPKNEQIEKCRNSCAVPSGDGKNGGGEREFHNKVNHRNDPFQEVNAKKMTSISFICRNRSLKDTLNTSSTFNLAGRADFFIRF